MRQTTNLIERLAAGQRCRPVLLPFLYETRTIRYWDAVQAQTRAVHVQSRGRTHTFRDEPPKRSRHVDTGYPRRENERTGRNRTLDTEHDPEPSGPRPAGRVDLTERLFASESARNVDGQGGRPDAHYRRQSSASEVSDFVPFEGAESALQSSLAATSTLTDNERKAFQRLQKLSRPGEPSQLPPAAEDPVAIERPLRKEAVSGLDAIG